MFWTRSFTLVLAAFLLGGSCPPNASAQTPATSQSETPLTVGQKRWQQALPVLLDAEQERAKLIAETEGRLRTLAYNQVSVEGGQRFCDLVLGLDARFMNREQLRGVIEAHASTHVFSAATMKAAERRQCEQLQLALKRIDSNVLVKLGVDTDLEAVLAAFPITAIDTAPLEEAAERSNGKLVDAVATAQAQQNALDLQSGAAGYMAGEAAEDAWRDENGDLSATAWLGSTIVGFVVGEAVSQVGEELTSNKRLLHKAAVRESVAMADFYAKGAALEARRRYWKDSVLIHAAITNGLTSRSLGLDDEWARAEHKRASEKRAQASK